MYTTILFLILTYINLDQKFMKAHEFRKIIPNNSVIAEKDNICRCSSSFPKFRVFNGTKVTAFEYEWTVGIYSTKSKSLLCTGSLISDITVLTGAHCLHQKNASDLQVLAGFVNNYEESIDSDWGSRNVITIILHAQFIENRKIKPNPYDLAILKLEKPFELGFNNSIYLACILENKINNPEKLSYYFAGYGAVLPFIIYYDKNTNSIQSTKKTFLNSLSTIKLDYDSVDCNMNQKFNQFFCIKSETGSLCSKDSGGGLYIFIGSRMVLVGVQASFGIYYYNDTTKLACYQASTSYAVKAFDHLDFIIENGQPKCKITNKFF